MFSDLLSLVKQYLGYLLFIVFQVVSIYLLYQSNTYHRVKLYDFSQEITGSLFGINNAWVKYFNLSKENEYLLLQNKRLLQNELNANSSLQSDTTFLKNNILKNAPKNNDYNVFTATVLKNTFYKPNNFITINKGAKDGIKADMAVLSEEGIVGIVVNVSNNFSLVMSILHNKFRLSAQHNKSDYKGAITWNVKDPLTVQLADIPKFIKLNKGDSISTSGYSSIFPSDFPVGVVKDFSISETSNNYEVDVTLNTDLRKLSNVYVLEFFAKQEIDSLNQLINE